MATHQTQQDPRKISVSSRNHDRLVRVALEVRRLRPRRGDRTNFLLDEVLVSSLEEDRDSHAVRQRDEDFRSDPSDEMNIRPAC